MTKNAQMPVPGYGVATIGMAGEKPTGILHDPKTGHPIPAEFQILQHGGAAAAPRTELTFDPAPLTEDQFEAQYETVPDNDGSPWRERLEEIEDTPDEFIWQAREQPDGSIHLISGRADRYGENPFAHVVTAQPWKEEGIVVKYTDAPNAYDDGTPFEDRDHEHWVGQPPTISNIKKTDGIAGQYQFTAAVDYGDDTGVNTVTFVGSAYGEPGPVTLILNNGTQTRVDDPSRFGQKLDEAWVKKFFGN